MTTPFVLTKTPLVLNITILSSINFSVIQFNDITVDIKHAHIKNNHGDT